MDHDLAGGQNTSFSFVADTVGGFTYYCRYDLPSMTGHLVRANPAKILWIEKLLQTSLDDYRKFVTWRILAPYLLNIRKCSVDEAYDTIRNWLNKCSELRRLDFHSNYMIKYNINSAKRGGYLPIGLDKLKIENTYLYNLLTKGVNYTHRRW